MNLRNIKKKAEISHQYTMYLSNFVFFVVLILFYLKHAKRILVDIFTVKTLGLLHILDPMARLLVYGSRNTTLLKML